MTEDQKVKKQVRRIRIILLVAIILTGVVLWSVWSLNKHRRPRFELIWSVEVEDQYITSHPERTPHLSIEGDVLFGEFTTIHSEEENAIRIRAFDCKTGRELWARPLSEIGSWSRISGEGLLCGLNRDTGSLKVFDIRDGNLLWEQNQIDFLLDVSGGNVHVIDRSSQYVILNANNGELIRRTGLVDDARTLLSMQCTNESIRYYLAGHRLIAIDDITNRILWTRNEIDPFTVLYAEKGYLFLLGDDLTVYRGRDGEKLWSRSSSLDRPMIKEDEVFLKESFIGDELKIRIININSGMDEGIITVQQCGKHHSSWIRYQMIFVGEADHYKSPQLKKLLKYYMDFWQLNTKDNWLMLIDPETGNPLCQSEYHWGFKMTHPLVQNEIIYVGVSDYRFQGKAKIFAYRLVE